MKTIRVMVPTYNEEENVEPIANAIREEFKNNLPNYNYQILFIDNKSKDKTREIIRRLCDEDHNIRAIFNAQNFGQFNSPYYGMIENEECAATITLCADFQEPVEMIHKFVAEWEKGYKVVVGVKSKTKRHGPIELFRKIYYKLSKKWSSVKFIEQYTGFGLYDISFTKLLKQIDDPIPFIRGIVVEYASDIKVLEYTQQKRRAGKSSNNFWSLYDGAMWSFTTYTSFLPRMAGVLGVFLSFLTFFGTIALIVLGFILPGFGFFWTGICALAFLLSLNMFFIGILGEYIIYLNRRVKHRPLVIEEERINFEYKVEE